MIYQFVCIDDCQLRNKKFDLYSRFQIIIIIIINRKVILTTNPELSGFLKLKAQDSRIIYINFDFLILTLFLIMEYTLL